MSGTWPPRAALAPSQQTPRRLRRSLWRPPMRSRISWPVALVLAVVLSPLAGVGAAALIALIARSTP